MRTANSEQRTANSEQRNPYQNLRVLFISHSPEIELGGGASISLYNLILDLQQRYNVIPSVLINKEGELSQKCREHNIEVFVMKYWWWTGASVSIKLKDKFKRLIKYCPRKIRNCFRNIRAYFKIKKLFRDKKFDIIHTNTCVINIGAKISKILNVPHVWQLKEYGMTFAPGDIYVRREFDKAAAVITISKTMYDYYVTQKRLCRPDNTRIIYDGVKTSEAYCKEFTHIHKGIGNINFCMIGVIHDNKNQLMAVRACAKLKTLTDNFTLHIIGSGDEKYIAELNNIIKAKNLEANVKFWGFRYDVDEILKTMDVGLMLSKREAF